MGQQAATFGLARATRARALWLFLEGSKRESFALESLDGLNMSRPCAGCGTEVARRDCHRNRYGEYICRRCQEAGIRSTRHRQIKRLFSRMLKYGLLGLACLALAGLLVAATYVILDHFASSTDSAS